MVATSRAERDRLVLENQGLVRMFAHWYVRSGKSRGMPYEDIVGCGQLGIIRAAEKFDPARGFAFGTYARRTIFRAMQAGVEKWTFPVCIPPGAVRRLAGYRKALDSMARGLGYEPSRSEVVASLGSSRTRRNCLWDIVAASELGRAEISETSAYDRSPGPLDTLMIAEALGGLTDGTDDGGPGDRDQHRPVGPRPLGAGLGRE